MLRAGRAAIRGAGLTVLLAVAAGCGSSSGTPPKAAAASPDLATALGAVRLPPGSAQVSAAGRPQADPRPLGRSGSRRRTQYWTSPRSMNATLAWISQHMASTWTAGPLDTYNLGREREWDGPANATENGPNVTVTVTAHGSGADVTIDAWTLPLGHKLAADTVTGVTGATAMVTNDNGSFIKPFALTLTAGQARRLADEINALRVNPPVTWSGLAGTPDVTLTFQTTHGTQRFLASRNGFLVQSLDGGDSLDMSAAMVQELDVDIPPGQSSRPPSDQHPVLPPDVSTITAVESWPDSHGDRKPTTTSLTGAAAKMLAADLRPLGQKSDAGVCHQKGRPTVDLRVQGHGEERDFAYDGNCDAVSALGGLPGQLMIPFQASPVLERDLLRLLP